MDSQIKYAYPFGDTKVIFEKEEVAQVKAFDRKGLRLIGFKPRSAIKPHLNISHSSFIYPDEQVLQKTLFVDLRSTLTTFSHHTSKSKVAQ